MTGDSSWSPYVGNDAIILALVLFVVGGVFALLGTRLRGAVGVRKPGRAISILLVLMWGLSIATFLVAVGAYVITLVQQVENINSPPNPIAPVTFFSALATFIIIAVLTKHHGLKTALGSAFVGAAAAPMIFEFPFDLIVMWRTYPPTPAALYTLLFFLPLFLVEFSTISLLTLSPLMRMSKYTLFSLAAMFFVFAIWALFGFSYPSRPIPIALNMISKVICFVVTITLFLPKEDTPAK